MKASMRRDIAPAAEPKRKKSALEDMIPSTSVRGRKRPRPGDPGTGIADASTMAILNAFKAKLDSADRDGDVDIDVVDRGKNARRNGKMNGDDDEPAAEATGNDGDHDNEREEEEAALCDLHFIANCQSCSKWDRNGEGGEAGDHEDEDEDENETDWMKHALSFAKDRLGKDLTWKRKNEEELVVIDPREREKEIKGKERGRRKATAAAAVAASGSGGR